MPTYNITARKTSPVVPVQVEAETRELAITQVVEQAGEGEEIEVLQCEELPAEGGSGGATGATGTSR